MNKKEKAYIYARSNGNYLIKAVSASDARRQAFYFFGDMAYTAIKVRRAPQFDDCPKRLDPQKVEV